MPSLVAQNQNLVMIELTIDGKGNRYFGDIRRTYKVSLGVAEGFMEMQHGVLGATAGFIGCNGF